jgi:O-antigen/teichoic acid export membrane protein
MGLVAHPQLVGYFSAAERVVRAAVLPAMPLRQTFFPTISARVHEDLPGAVKLVRKILLYAGSLAAVLSLVLFAFAEPLVRLAVGDQFGDSVPVLRIMAVLPLIFLIQEVLSVLWLLPMRCDRYCSVVVATAGTVHLVGVFAFSALWGAQGTALAMVLSNLTALCLFVLKTARLKAHPLVTIGSRVD